jgi:hypothetical protein
MMAESADVLALFGCEHGTARLTREDMALLLTALQLADEGPEDTGYRLVLWKVRTALGLEA